MTGIRAFGAYVPLTRLPLALIGGRPAKDGGPEKAVAYNDEDSVTMAVAAAVDCLGDLDRSAVDALWFASTTHPFREKQGAALVAKALDLRRDVRSVDSAGTLRAGTGALLDAFAAVASGAARNALVVAADCRMAAPRGPLEANFGDAAAAFLIGAGDGVATLEGSHSVVDEIQDVWRAAGDDYTHSWEDRFVVSEGYTPVMAEAVSGLLATLGRQPADVACAAIYGPDKRSHGGLVRALGLKPEQVQDPFFGRVGNTGTSFALLQLAAALEKARPGDRLLVASYGDGADALALRVAPGIDGFSPRRGVTGHLERRRALKSYDSYLRARDLMPKEYEAGGGGGLSATVRFRDRDAEIGFLGGRCRECGQIHLPTPRVCYRCHTKDRWEPVRLSDKRGKLMAFTFDFFFPAPEPPTVMTMVEVEGCRVQLQLADARAEDVALDLPVEFSFRKIHAAGGKPNYYWKAVPAAEGDPS